MARPVLITLVSAVIVVLAGACGTAPDEQRQHAQRMAQEGNVACEIKIVAPGELAASGAKFAHLTGVDAVDFSMMDSAAILVFLKNGGTGLLAG
jgi:hypothetical protein